MIYLTAAVILVGSLCALDLLLTVGVIRRLREHTEALATMSRLGTWDSRPWPPGTAVPEVSVVTAEGTEIALRSPASTPFLVAFLSTDCEGCLEQLPQLESYAAGLPGGQDAVLIVLTGDDDAAGELRDRLAPLARVVVEPESGPLLSAFAVSTWPAYLLLGELGVVDAAGHAVQELPGLPIDPGLRSAPR